MPKMKAQIRILQSDSKGRQKLSFPTDVGWHEGDVVQYEKKDENLVLLRRLHS